MAELPKLQKKTPLAMRPQKAEGADDDTPHTRLTPHIQTGTGGQEKNAAGSGVNVQMGGRNLTEGYSGDYPWLDEQGDNPAPPKGAAAGQTTPPKASLPPQEDDGDDDGDD